MAGERFILEPTVLALLRDLDLSASRVLRRAQLPTGLLRGRTASLTQNEYSRFWEALDAEAGRPDLSVSIAQAISAELFNPPLFAALCSPNLAVAAQRIAEYKLLVGPTSIAVDSGAAGLTVRYRWPTGFAPPPLLVTTELLFWVALARIATRHHVTPTQVTTRHRQPDPGAVAAYLGVPVRVGTDDAISFALEDTVRPFLTENESMWRFFAPDLRRRLADLRAEASATERVQSALVEALPAGGHTLAEIARRLATSPRTLQRRLQGEGTSFQSVLASTRERLARHYLAQSDLSALEIAYLLAYEDANSFYRAFRSWTGATPDAIRADNARTPRTARSWASPSSAGP